MNSLGFFDFLNPYWEEINEEELPNWVQRWLTHNNLYDSVATFTGKHYRYRITGQMIAQGQSRIIKVERHLRKRYQKK